MREVSNYLESRGRDGKKGELSRADNGDGFEHTGSGGGVIT
jgi:hypothetical protein